MKQSKLRRRRVIRYAILYFVLLVVFVALIAAPAVIGDKILPSLKKPLADLAGFNLLQPNDLDKDDTWGSSVTGTGIDGYTGYLASEFAARKTRKGAEPTDKIKLF
jgi:1,3-beta-glucan synthase